MILIFLIVLVVALALANIFVRLTKKDRKTTQIQKTEVIHTIEPEIVGVFDTINEKNALIEGNVSATKRKLDLVNERVSTLERAVSELAEIKINNNKSVDIEKIDFRISVLEQQIEELKNPHEKQNTFYGKENDPMEDEIRSLVFNSKRKI